MRRLGLPWSPLDPQTRIGAWSTADWAGIPWCHPNLVRLLGQQDKHGASSPEPHPCLRALLCRPAQQARACQSECTLPWPCQSTQCRSSLASGAT